MDEQTKHYLTELVGGVGDKVDGMSSRLSAVEVKLDERQVRLEKVEERVDALHKRLWGAMTAAFAAVLTTIGGFFTGP